MERIRHRLGEIIIVGLIQALVAIPATIIISWLVSSDLATDIGIIVVWVMVILAGAGIIIARITTGEFIRRGDTVRLEGTTGPPIPLEESESIEFPQLSLILKQDLASPAPMVKIMERRVVKWDLPARRSEVVFGVTIFNGSVYDVWVSPATGNLMYKGQQLETAILPNQGGAMRLPRGKEYEITLTQYVPDDLTHEVHGEIESGCIRMFGWMGVSVSLRADRPDAPEATPMFIGDGKGFRVGD